MPRGIIIFGSAGADKTTLDSHYETDGSPCLKTHLEWAATLPCKVLYLSGKDELSINVKQIIEAYMRSHSSR